MRDSKRPWHRNTSNITSLDISSSQQASGAQIIGFPAQGQQAMLGQPQAMSRVTFKEIQQQSSLTECQTSNGQESAPAQVPTKKKSSLYKRINQIKEKCKYALEELADSDDDRDEAQSRNKTKSFQDLPQSYRDHVEVKISASPTVGSSSLD